MNHQEDAADAIRDERFYATARERELAFIAACRESRERRGWSQRELSRRLNAFGLHLAQSSIGKMEGTDDDGRRPVTLAEAVVLSRVLGVKIHQFIAGADDDEDLVQLVDRLKAERDIQGHYLIELMDLPGQMIERMEEIARRFSADMKLGEVTMREDADG